MKQFKFKLEALLKYRKFKETKIKHEMSLVLKEVNEIKDEIARTKSTIHMTYETQEHFLKESSTAENIKFFPAFIEGKRSYLDKLNNEITRLNEFYQIKMEQVNIARGEVDLVTKIKDKEMIVFKKLKNKKEMEFQEELVSVKFHKKERDL